MPGIVVLTTDTTHHRYFLNYLNRSGIEIDLVLFETTSINAAFPAEAPYRDKEIGFEQRRWKGLLSLETFSCVEVRNFNQRQSLTLLTKFLPDLGLVFGARPLDYGVRNLFKDGLLNVHRGIPENYRGLDSELWPIYHRDWNGLGVTIHMVDENLDTGPILAQERLVLDKSMRIHHLRCYTTEVAARMMVEILKSRSSLNLPIVPQERNGRYYSFMPTDLKRICEVRFNKFCRQL
jgi:methionyl-tRNA formyltransferase